jgi:hypothetical protein
MNDNRFLNAAAIQKALDFLPQPDLLLATSASGISNVMTIGWAKETNYHRLYVGEIVHLRRKRQWQNTSRI